MVHAAELIRRKRDGEELDADEIANAAQRFSAARFRREIRDSAADCVESK